MNHFHVTLTVYVITIIIVLAVADITINVLE